MQTAVSSRMATVPAVACAAELQAPAVTVETRRPAAISAADYALDSAAIRTVRFAVFVDEQAVPANLEMDDRDPHCFHVLAHVADEAVGTGRIDIDEASRSARVGRMAVLAGYRGDGIGARLLEALHEHARQRDCVEVWCHAQLAAQSFYARAGYVAEGGVFVEAGIDHITMRRSLQQRP